jgi:SAM-dependent methyltransferase
LLPSVHKNVREDAMAVQFFHSQLDYKDLLDTIVQPGCRWLDIGCGCSIVPSWIHDSVEFQHQILRRCEIACGCDPIDDRPHIAGLQKYVGDCTVLPYPNGFFNLVTANMVVEHVRDTAAFAREVRRVLVPRGRFVLHTPNLRCPLVFLASHLPSKVVRIIAKRLDGRDDEDIFPTFYRLNTREAISSLPGFKVTYLRCFRDGPILRKLPIAREVESLLINHSSHPLLRDLQADWIAVLENLPEQPPSSDHSETPGSIVTHNPDERAEKASQQAAARNAQPPFHSPTYQE